MKEKGAGGSGWLAFVGVLGFIFIALKLTHQVDWSWWVVLLPMWILPALWVLGFIIYVVTFRKKVFHAD